MTRSKRTKPAEPGSLFVRNVPQATLDALERWAEQTQMERGTMVTRADIIREILHAAVQARLAVK